jgi:hypothetical protein
MFTSMRVTAGGQLVRAGVERTSKGVFFILQPLAAIAFHDSPKLVPIKLPLHCPVDFLSEHITGIRDQTLLVLSNMFVACIV